MPTVRALLPPSRKSGEKKPSDGPSDGVRLAVVVAVLVLLAAAWAWTPLRDLLDLRRLAGWMEEYRSAWYALPLLVVAYVVLGLFMISVLLLILATGVAFGPWLGCLYALAGCLVSASVGFAIGRWAGLRRVERLGGERVQRLTTKLRRNGTLAVYLLRKVPAPFMLSNIVMGASKIRYRDYLLGTLLGMTPIIVALAGFGYQLTRVFEDPSPGKIALTLSMLIVPLSLAWFINRTLKKRMRGS
jgi:uncharacterized membrane protein YdjX (TVP38/TMEM64 family)